MLFSRNIGKRGDPRGSLLALKCVLKQKNPCVVAVQLLYLCTPEVKQCWRNQMQVDVIFKLGSVTQPVLSPLLNIVSFPGRACEVAVSMNVLGYHDFFLVEYTSQQLSIF